MNEQYNGGLSFDFVQGEEYKTGPIEYGDDKDYEYVYDRDGDDIFGG